MSKTQMVRRNRVYNVDARLAPLLVRHGGYQRRDMQAQPAVAPAPAQPDRRAVEENGAAALAKRDAAAESAGAPREATKAKPKKLAKKPGNSKSAKNAGTTQASDMDAAE
ncbi:hypothetical protein KWH04_15835 [Xanthomonas campestris pv. trichodesmae]|uniref:Uncharacterized protein n=2 Tax=Xanthomonas citri TaxID=346 RepID=A0AB33CFT1_XANCI|nr:MULTISPECIES: hypothetical protein [Xanthomonas]MBV6782081.1 hypothetical protein [Xanthomonas campestris pv. trichodesmae]ASK92635.1 hypothetical protein XcvCFBP7111P_15060 [Xanthomonas citri pv. vignicola]MBV6687349.1 hypothetical protein [Xanthomonas euvesicatoria pv. physalidis]MBZ3920429.1 hypothetical protein [Xanthomonas campestris pv. trichodesmae]MBZ3923802.1 hypothetical protein [Xanthomonas citri pv. sesbaniae]